MRAGLPAKFFGGGLSRGSGFTRFADAVGQASGKAGAFAVAVLVVIIWIATGPIFHFSDTWQLVINTGTTIITFLMVFAIQNTQNRDTLALQLKLDELIIATDGARNEIVGIEDAPEKELERLHNEEKRRAQRAFHARPPSRSDRLDFQRSRFPGRAPRDESTHPRGGG